ncbi:hypothetical protein EKE94_13420 [Mesobaculum littorinae]|uniref:Zinc transport system substrate-binding protein n=1 Tax=Mesobaculum littorinae TaxID=2486419 RepID=A0A438AFR0_9RHOB|nr:metallochaperone AztD [Mesobaculum littorinae]RVV97534.1 hypothetical protein EKE94_13420 [Mesobaculum littorinae]
MTSRLTRAALLSAAFIAGPAMAQDDTTIWRIFVADQETGRITALDLDTPDTRWTFDVAGPATLFSVPTGEAIVAIQSDHDQVNFLDSGVALHAHGDHADISVSDPALIDGALTGPRPFHIVTHDGESAINFDRGGYAAILDDAAMLDGATDPKRFEQARAHHGFAAPFGDYVISSVATDTPTKGDDLPPRAGLAAFTPGGAQVGEMQTCTDLHGEAISGNLLLAGCAEGVATVRIEDGAPVFGMLPYPEDAPDEHTGHVWGAKAMQIFLGDHGPDAVVVISPQEEPAMTRVSLPYREVDTILDPARPQDAYILTEDGTLHRLNLLSAEIEDSRQVTGPYSMDGHWRDPRPCLAIAGDRIVISDPDEAQLRVLDAETMEETATIPVEGLPFNLLALGGSGLTH